MSNSESAIENHGFETGEETRSIFAQAPPTSRDELPPSARDRRACSQSDGPRGRDRCDSIFNYAWQSLDLRCPIEIAPATTHLVGNQRDAILIDYRLRWLSSTRPTNTIGGGSTVFTVGQRVRYAVGGSDREYHADRLNCADRWPRRWRNTSSPPTILWKDDPIVPTGEGWRSVGSAAGKTYYITRITPATIRLSETRFDAVRGGSGIALTVLRCTKAGNHPALSFQPKWASGIKIAAELTGVQQVETGSGGSAADRRRVNVAHQGAPDERRDDDDDSEERMILD